MTYRPGIQDHLFMLENGGLVRTEEEAREAEFLFSDRYYKEVACYDESDDTTLWALSTTAMPRQMPAHTVWATRFKRVCETGKAYWDGETWVSPLLIPYVAEVTYYPIFSRYWVRLGAERLSDENKRLDLACRIYAIPPNQNIENRIRNLAACIYVSAMVDQERRATEGLVRGIEWERWERTALLWWAHQAAEAICSDWFFRGGEG